VTWKRERNQRRLDLAKILGLCVDTVVRWTERKVPTFHLVSPYDTMGGGKMRNNDEGRISTFGLKLESV